MLLLLCCFFFQAEDGIRDLVRSRGLGDVYKRQGLLNAIRASTISLADAGAQTLEFIKSHVPEGTKVPLCGNSIGMDRRFLVAYPVSYTHLTLPTSDLV